MLIFRLFAISCFCLVTINLAAQEQINSFHADITLNLDGSMLVTESINVKAEGNKIKRGIYRDFPTRYTDQYGNSYVVDFELIAVSKNDATENFMIENRSNGVRIYLGDKNTILSRGNYLYRIQYKTNRQLGFFEKHDELYWNVTGNQWQFNILKASATVRLPEGIASDDIKVNGFTGLQGSKASFYQAAIVPNGDIYFESTQLLNPNEGLSIVVSFPKGTIIEPTFETKIAYLLTDNKALFIALIGTLLILAYYIYAWRKVGMDPDEGVIFPEYEAYEGFSPASMRYIKRMGYDHKTFVSALLSLAVKGYCEITDNDDEEFTVIQIKSNLGDDLAAGEKEILLGLFKESDTVSLKQENHKLIREAISAHNKSLKSDYNKRYFKKNTLYLLPAILSTIILAIVVISIASQPTLFLFICFALLLVSHVTFFNLMKAPTMRGRKLLDRFEGLKLYLETAEKDELNLKNPPQKTPENFEYFLPFATALDVEQQWAEKFTAMFSKLEAQGKTTQPIWYSGYHWQTNRLDSFSKTIGTSFNTAIRSSSTPPGSSSGSSGGGFSGGGGGGGGGGGW